MLKASGQWKHVDICDSFLVSPTTNSGGTMLGAWPLAEGRVAEDAAAAEVAAVSWEDGQLALVHFPRA